MATLQLSPELHETLQQLAEADQRSVDEVVEEVMAQYARLRLIQVGGEPTEEEIAAVIQALADSDYEEEHGLLLSQEEVEANVYAMIDGFEDKPEVKKASKDEFGKMD